MGFGKQLKLVLNERAMTVTELAKRTGIPATTLYSIINKDLDTLGLDKVKKIEEVLNIAPGDILYCMMHELEYKPTTIAAHFDGSEYTEEQLDQIRAFAKFIKEQDNKKDPT